MKVKVLVSRYDVVEIEVDDKFKALDYGLDDDPILRFVASMKQRLEI